MDITERKRAEEQIQEQLQTLSALYAGAQRLTESLDLEEVAKQVTRTCVEVFKVRLAWLGRANPDGSVKPLSWFPEETAYLREISVRWDDTPEGQGPTGRAIRSGFPQIIEDIAGDPRFAPWRETALQAGLSTSAAFPLISRGETFGALNLYSDQPGFFSPERLEMFQAFAHQAAAALENTRLFEETHRRLAHITALRNIDMAITGSLDLRVTFNVALDEIVNQLKIDAASILRLDPYTQTLEYAAGRGFRTRAIEQSRLRLGEGHAGRAALERRIVHIPNLLETGRDFLRADLLKGEGFMTYFAAPLIAKGRVLGVLEIFHRSPLEGNDEWLNFLETLAGQTAIAIDNTRLFYDLERANVSLLQAYDATIEGWSRALDLRDKETEGHTQRVTELTLRLAREMGISDEELIHLRRGALLHDIGKMGIPDHILLKPGPLTEEEWEIMRKHPQYAYEMLSPIEYLRPALDIPYCHHEKWDGTGYPRGLKGEQIPLAARIFAVVDVWDALTSDRPYRGAWPKEKALEYIREQSGKHFDPKVVELFLEIANQIQDT
ncbi:MAG: GAF domain-containing protein [Caldiserica bacterium]|nr:GAF domain-containing protein [Caldisericota bacterium]